VRATHTGVLWGASAHSRLKISLPQAAVRRRPRHGVDPLFRRLYHNGKGRPRNQPCLG